MKLLFLPGSVFPNSYQDKYFKIVKTLPIIANNEY